MIPENLLENNKFEIFFDELIDGPELRKLYSQKLEGDTQLEKECKLTEELNDGDNSSG